MNVYHDLNDLPAFRNAVLTIGSFDGVHQGHQSIIERINLLSKEYDGESIVITFHPHPRLILHPKDKSLHLITTIDEKIALLRQYGVDNVVVVRFSVAFSQMKADEYIEKFLIEKFHPACIVIGYDHRFGLNRQGDINYLKWYGEIGNYKVQEIEKQEVEAITVSSTKVRQALQAGKVKKASQLLGHYFTISGKVVYGQQIGTKIGFPTANIEITSPHKLIPPDGIYAVYVTHQKNRYKGMLYIGKRPTVDGALDRTIEVNIFNFAKNIYGDKLLLELVDFIREDQKFDSLEGLKTQLTIDEQHTLACLKYEEIHLLKAPEKPQPSVAVVILNYNGEKWLEKMLPSVQASNYANFKIYVADNGSTDESKTLIKENFSDVIWLDLEENHGFAEGYNQALRQIESTYYVLLNSDVEVAEDWITPIINLMERDQTVAACQPKILSFNNRDQFEYAGAAGGWIDKWGYPFCRGRIFHIVEQDQRQHDDTQEIFWASGAALFIRASLFHNIGGFDGSYFAHLEEIDLCWRLKRAGYKIMARPKSVVYHVGGGTLDYENPKKTYLNFRNSLFTLMKNEAIAKLIWLIPLRLFLDGIAGILFLVKGQFGNIAAIFRAHWHFFPRIAQLLQQRKATQELIDKTSISQVPNKNGRLDKSIIWQFYIRRKKYFRQLRMNAINAATNP